MGKMAKFLKTFAILIVLVAMAVGIFLLVKFKPEPEKQEIETRLTAIEEDRSCLYEFRCGSFRCAVGPLNSGSSSVSHSNKGGETDESRGSRGCSFPNGS